MLREGGAADLCGGIPEHGHETASGEAIRRGQTGEFRQGWKEVSQFGERMASGGRDAWCRDEEGDAGIEFKVRRFAPEGVFAEVEAVIRPERDDGLAGEPRGIECVEDAPELGIEEADGGEVAMAEFAGGIGREGSALLPAEDFLGTVAGDGGGVLRPCGGRDFRKMVTSVKVPVAFRGIEGSVRFPEADCEEGRLRSAGGVVDRSDGGGRNASVDEGVVRDVAAFAFRVRREVWRQRVRQLWGVGGMLAPVEFGWDRP